MGRIHLGLVAVLLVFLALSSLSYNAAILYSSGRCSSCRLSRWAANSVLETGDEVMSLERKQIFEDIIRASADYRNVLEILKEKGYLSTGLPKDILAVRTRYSNGFNGLIASVTFREDRRVGVLFAMFETGDTYALGIRIRGDRVIVVARSVNGRVYVPSISLAHSSSVVKKTILSSVPGCEGTIECPPGYDVCCVCDSYDESCLIKCGLEIGACAASCALCITGNAASCAFCIICALQSPFCVKTCCAQGHLECHLECCILEDNQTRNVEKEGGSWCTLM